MISAIYEYYISNYGNKDVSRHDTHKKSELRDIYSIVKINKAAPFYKVDTSEKSQKLAIDIKEASRALTHTIEDIQDTLNGKLKTTLEAKSSNPQLVTAKYIGSDTDYTEDTLNFEVKQLATPQINTGNYLGTGARNLFAGKYSFDIVNGNTTYELQFTVENDDNNDKVQNKLVRLINSSKIGLKAETVRSNLGQQAIQITSEATGSGSGSPYLFRIKENDSALLVGAVNTFGLDNVSQVPSNAVFNLDGVSEISPSNTFIVGKDYEVTLHGTSDELGAGQIQLAKSGEFAAKELIGLADNYNKLLTLTDSDDNYDLQRLHRSLIDIVRRHKSTLEANCITVNEDYSLSVNDETVKASVDSNSIYDNLTKLSSFKDDLKAQVQPIELNPMEYINKKVVAYKNPQRLVHNPYAASLYAGMMFDGQV